jgi:hypothetical protein
MTANLEYDTVSEFFYGIVYENIQGNTRIIAHDGSVYTRESSLDNFSFFELFEKDYKGSIIDLETSPYLISNDCGTIDSFDFINYDNDTIELLNRTGLKIFLYEILLYDVSPVKRKFRTRIGSDYQEDIVNGFMSSEENLNNLYSFDLDSIAEFVRRNALTNVTVCVCDYNVEKFLQKKYPEFAIRTVEVFLKSLINQQETNAYGIQSEYKTLINADTITHKFWCGNWRYTQHRHLTAAFMSAKSCLMSWAFKNDLFSEFNLFDLAAWQQTKPALFSELLIGNETLKTSVPLTLDISFNATDCHSENTPYIDEDHLDFCPSVVTLPIDFYKRCFCAVVTESEFFRPTGSLSEKTINAIKAGRPFVLVAPPTTIEFLHKLGFKTFGEFWDESYDQESDHEQRFIKVLNLIKEIDRKPLSELQCIYRSMTEILQHNFDNLYKLRLYDKY